MFPLIPRRIEAVVGQLLDPHGDQVLISRVAILPPSDRAVWIRVRVGVRGASSQDAAQDEEERMDP
jgi:hypothetical protein